MADTTRPLGVQISHMLKDRGVDVIFGIPGVHNQELYRGIEEAGIRHILARHEQGAGFMADGYARATGKPGVAYVITGPGLTNIMTPMGQAYSDSVPMLVFSSCLDETAARRGQLHQMKDQRAAAETVCDWSEEAQTPEAAYALIDRALAEFKMNRPRPKHIQVPISVLEADAPSPPPRVAVWQDQAFRVPPGVIEQIAQAKRPLFVLGGGAVGCGYQVRDVLKLLGAASFETYAGRGVAGPGALNFGSYLARPGSAEVIGAADCIVLIGTEVAETDIWRNRLGVSGYCVQVDLDPASRSAEADVHLICRAEVFLDALSEALEGHRSDSVWDPAEVRATRKRWRTEVDADYPGVLRVVDALRKCVPNGTTVYSDMTQFAYAAKEVWPMTHSGSWHHPYGFGTLGYALPAAIGGTVAVPRKFSFPTMAIIGDYGFHYTMAELGVAVELKLPIPIILWDNGKLGAIEASMVGAQIAPNAVVARNPDFVKLAEAFGAASVKPGTLEEMQAAVQQAFSAFGPTLVHVTPDVLG
ncbi:thiamine pyrophosphate-binding protein [Marimonas sp. MJW-29]|uniref:Thiamine pyrophosphate-binding protein n=1 Tax=Sulfitobacter sediminis TaxID=3234186 RepID=A0ABV3RKE8_9RHOB